MIIHTLSYQAKKKNPEEKKGDAFEIDIFTYRIQGEVFAES